MLSVLKLFSVLIVHSISYDLTQGPISVRVALTSWKRLQFYTSKHQINFKNFSFDPDEFQSLDEKTSRFKTNCPICTKSFKNSSFTLYHYYRHHLSEQQASTIIKLNYMCSFINCQKQTQEQTGFQPIRFKKCLHFAQQYLSSDVVRISDFCEDLIQDQTDLTFTLWQEVYPVLRRTGLIIFILLTVVYIYRTYYYFQQQDLLHKNRLRRLQDSDQTTYVRFQ